MAALIFSKELHKLILEANTPQKAKALATKISNECEEWRILRYNDGYKSGRNDLQIELRGLLNAQEKTEE